MAKKTGRPSKFTDKLADEISLCGPKDRIRERLQDWKKSAVTTMMIGVSPFGPEESERNMEFMAEVVL